ncbi:MAG: hypothetical protein MK052_09100 [Alphaproteobacteria bacterium]|nr:hypothetical protein [Alphaproteobacteria bacterium]
MRLLMSCLFLLFVTACSSSESVASARINCANSLSGEGYEACVKNAGKF